MGKILLGDRSYLQLEILYELLLLMCMLGIINMAALRNVDIIERKFNVVGTCISG
jgi:hypothetical protein